MQVRRPQNTVEQTSDGSPSLIAYNSSYLPIYLSPGRAMRCMGLAADIEK
jgi:hypothetical protein